MTDPQQLLTRMLVSTINAREMESDRVSRTLHDEVGQVLSAVGLQLDVLKLDFQDRIPEIAERTVEIQKMLDRAVHGSSGVELRSESGGGGTCRSAKRSGPSGGKNTEPF